MSIDLDRFLVETATKVVTTINEDGDLNYGSTTSSACLYRDISAISHIPNRDEVNLHGILWFAADESVVKNDIYQHPDEGYLQVVTITRAKRLLADNTTQFMKCGVIKIRQIS